MHSGGLSDSGRKPNLQQRSHRPRDDQLRAQCTCFLLNDQHKQFRADLIQRFRDSFADRFVANGIGCGENYHSDSCLSEIQALNYYGNHDGISVNLGTPFHLTYTAVIASGGGGPSADNVYGRASLNMAISYQLFEADGITPVEVLSDVPEPSTWSLMAVPFVVALIRKRRRWTSIAS